MTTLIRFAALFVPLLFAAVEPAAGADYFSSAPRESQPDRQGRPYIAPEYTPPDSVPGSPKLGNKIARDIDTDLALAVIRDDAIQAQALLKQGANVDCNDCAGGREAGKTPLMLAAEYGAERAENNMLRLLLRYGANPNAQTPDGKTALFFAARAGLGGYGGARDTATELLLAGANPGHASKSGHTPIFWWAGVAINPRAEPNPQQREALYRDFLAIAKTFHSLGADLSQREKGDGWTALHFAAALCNPHTTLLMQALGFDAASGTASLLMPTELVQKRIREEGESRQCRQTLDVLENRGLVEHWKLAAFQVAPLISAK